jgi:hypothetical protein
MKLKMIAIAGAAMSMFGSAHADLSAPGAANGSFVLTAVNTANQNWYMRDLGFFINSFLPSNITTATGDGAVTGDKTPAAGLTLNASNTANFGDASFSTWLSAQTLADVKWIVTATDSTGISATDRRRMVVSSANANETFLNGNVTNFVGTPVAGSLTSFFGNNTLSTTGTLIGPTALAGFNLGADALAAVGQSVNLFYAFRSSTTGGGDTNAATSQKYFNATGNALVTLNANGDFSYVLAGAPVGEVPLPATVWLMGAGLAAVGGFIRRRKAAVQA